MGPTRLRTSRSNQISSKYLLKAWGPTHRGATKEGSKAINRDLVNYHTCSLSYNINVSLYIE